MTEPSQPHSSKKGVKSQPPEEITELRKAALELREENFALREEVKKLREDKIPETSLEFFENVYWLLTGNERTGPFCPRCYSEHQRLATLLDGRRFVAKTRWICPVCNHVFDSDT